MKLNNYTKALGVLSLVVILGVIYVLFQDTEEEVEVVLKNNQNEEDDFTKDEKDNQEEIDKVKKTIFVEICGAVNQPNVYEVEEGTRIFEVLEMAGGLTEEAAPFVINQAEPAMDGQQVYFPTQDEVDEGYHIDENKTNNYLININSATLEQLISIPGIGETKAKNIIEYREENGKFNSIEDIMNIDGIKEGIFNKIKEYISVKINIEEVSV
ncbi:MAG: helix-hairpin-helix domain-containing protein [Eubacteriales bacterium]